MISICFDFCREMAFLLVADFIIIMNYDCSSRLFARSCIGFLGNQSGAPRTGHRARPQVADRGAPYRGLLLNTDTKLNKQSRTMFQGWSRRNNPQAKVLTTVPRAAWHQGVVSLGNQVTS